MRGAKALNADARPGLAPRSASRAGRLRLPLPCPVAEHWCVAIAGLGSRNAYITLPRAIADSAGSARSALRQRRKAARVSSACAAQAGVGRDWALLSADTLNAGCRAAVADGGRAGAIRLDIVLAISVACQGGCAVARGGAGRAYETQARPVARPVRAGGPLRRRNEPALVGCSARGGVAGIAR